MSLVAQMVVFPLVAVILLAGIFIIGTGGRDE